MITKRRPKTLKEQYNISNRTGPISLSIISLDHVKTVEILPQPKDPHETKININEILREQNDLINTR